MSNSHPEHSFGTWDYVVVSSMIVTSTAIGLLHAWLSRKYKTTEEFLIKGVNITMVPLIISSVASRMSTLMILGQPTDSYNNGFQTVLLAGSYALGMLLAIYAIYPVYFRLSISSVYQYLEHRFQSRLLKNSITVLYLVQSCITTSSVVHLTSLVLSDAIGISYWASMAIICGTCVIYTSLGGFTAVIWTDVIQMSVVVVILLTLAIKGTNDVGGVFYVWNRNYEGNNTVMIRAASENDTDYTIWSIVIGGIIVNLGAGSTSQSLLQRQIANGTLFTAKMTATLAMIIHALFLALLAWLGMILYARYHDCDPVLNNEIHSRDQLLAQFAKEIFFRYEGLTGLFIAGILASSLSMLSSMTNSFTAVVLVNIVNIYWPDLSESTTTILSKICGLLFGLLIASITFLVRNVDGITQFMYIVVSTVSGPTCGVFLLGMLFPWATWKGATAGYVCGISICGWAAVGRLIYFHTKSAVRAGLSTAGCVTDIIYTLNGTTFGGNEDLLIEFVGLSDAVLYETKFHNSTLPDSQPIADVFAMYRVGALWYFSMALVTVLIIGMIVSVLTGIQDLDSLNPRLISPFIWHVLGKMSIEWRKKLGFKSDKFHGDLTLISDNSACVANVNTS